MSVPAPEIDAIVRQLLAQFSNKRIVFVCHSRGGLLARDFLQRNRNDMSVLSRIAGVITLHTPHQGSEVADFVETVHTALVNAQNATFDPAAKIALGALDSIIMKPSINDLKTSSPFLANLRNREATPLPISIPIHTFGGTNPRLISVYLSIFDPFSAYPQWHWPPYHWVTNQFDILDALDGTPVALICPEERPGGDVLVTETRSHLPGEASHHTNPVNHATVLSDANVQAQLRDVLQTLRSNAVYVTQNVPPSMVAGSTYPVSITMRNSGSAGWAAGGNTPFRLGLQNPPNNSVWGISRRDVPGPISPGATATFNFNVTAPAVPGSFHFQWRMLQENVEWFGQSTPDVVVQVTQSATVAQFWASPSSAPAGTFVTLTVVLASAAPAGGIQVQMTTSNNSVIMPPATLLVAAGATSVSVQTWAALVSSPRSVTLTAAVGNSTKSISVTVSPSAQYPYGTGMSAGVGGALL